MKKIALILLVLILVTLVLSGRSVRFGLLLDDYNHRAQLRDGDWSFNSLVEAAHLGGPRRRGTMWWQKHADLRFFRPLAFAFMRAEYSIGQWQPAVMHGFSLVWGIFCAFLVTILARKTTSGLPWALSAGVLFLVHPANVLTVCWIACQNGQMATAFILLALVCYGRYAYWFQSNLQPIPQVDQPKRNHWFLFATLLCFAAALGCRESAVMLAPMLFWGDFLLSPRKLRSNWFAYAAIAVLVIIFLLLRYHFLGAASIPQRPYGYPITEPGFIPFVANKFVYYLLGLFAFFPIVGFAGLDAITANPAFFYGTFFMLLLAWSSLLRLIDPCHRRRAVFFIGLAVLSFLPVLPVFASAHHLFAASAFGMIALIILLKGLAHRFQTVPHRSTRLIKGAVFAIATAFVVALTATCIFYRETLFGLHASSQLPVKEAVQLDGHFKTGDRLFFINLSPLGFNCLPGIEETTGVSPLKGYVLTFSPEFPAITTDAHVQQVGKNKLRIWLEEQSYFAGLQGRSMLEASRREQPFQSGETFTTEDFEVQIIQADQQGVRELLFTFPRPLNSDTYHFFLASRWFAAYPLRFH